MLFQQNYGIKTWELGHIFPSRVQPNFSFSALSQRRGTFIKLASEKCESLREEDIHTTVLQIYSKKQLDKNKKATNIYVSVTTFLFFFI